MKKTNFFKWTTILAIVLNVAIAFGQTHIADRVGLAAIANNLTGSYILDNDIDLSGSDWAPIGDNSNRFTGTLDGNGHIIRGLRYVNILSDGSDYPGGSRKIGLFSVIGSGGTVKNLGIEDAYIVGGKHVGGIAGSLIGTAVVEKCYVANSYIETGDHGGSIAGNMEGGAIVRNCYANGMVYSRNNQGSGLVGMFKNNGTAISKCYFSGVVSSGNPSAIGAWSDDSYPACEYSVNLASYILGSGNVKVCAGRNSTMTGLYSLLNSYHSGTKDDFTTTTTLTNTSDVNYGSTKMHGAHIPGGDANAKVAGQTDFYESLLAWDFTETWQFKSDGYPVLKWQTGKIALGIVKFLNPDKSVNATGMYSLKSGNSIDFTGLLVKGQDVAITLASTNAKLTISNNTASIDGNVAITAPEWATVTITPVSNDFTCAQTIKILLLPNDDSAVIEIAATDDFKGISLLPNRNYKLVADLDFSGEQNFTGVCSKTAPFTGTFDGNGHIIRGFSINRPSVEGVGLFNVLGTDGDTGTGGTIKKLGIEGASVIGAKQTGVIVGEARYSTIEECFVQGSYSQSNDHVGAIAGRITRGSTLQNCYAASTVYSTGSQAGGLVGVIQSSTVTKSYFAGTVASNGNRANGIVCLVDGTQTVNGTASVKANINNCVALAPYLERNSTEDARFFRIVNEGGSSTGNELPLERLTLSNNYALASMKMSDNKGSDRTTRTSSNPNNSDGADITKTQAVSQAFYESLGWPFGTIWKMIDGYPVLQWQTSTINTWNIIKESASLTYPNTFDLYSVVNSTHGLTLNFDETSDYITITNNSVIEFDNPIFAPVDVTVTISPENGSFTVVEPATIVVHLFPEQPVMIHSASDLQYLNTAPTLAFELAGDIDASNHTFTPVDNFNGVLDGAGHIIKGLSYSNSTERYVGLIRHLSGTVKNLGLENVDFVGNEDVGGIAGETTTGAIIENCYVGNSYIEGRDHVAAIVGGMKQGATIRNSYANARVHSREHQAGGIAGVMQRDDLIENCYYAGIVSNPNNRAVGIGGYQDDSSAPAGHYPTIKNSVSLAPHLLSGNWANDALRIFSDASNTRPVTLENNYGLTTTWRGKPDYSEGALVPDNDSWLGADKPHGAHVTSADAKTQTFYATTLNWDFNNTWKMLSSGYPVLKWQTTPVIVSTIYKKDDYNLEKDDADGIDFAEELKTSHGIDLIFDSDDTEKLTLTGSLATVAGSWNESSAALATISVAAGNTANFTFAETLDINVIPAATFSDATLSALSVNGVSVPAFAPNTTNYEVYVDETVENATIEATAPYGAITGADLGSKSLVIGQNRLTVHVTSGNGVETKTYNLTVHRGLFSVLPNPDLNNTEGKYNVNIASWNAYGNDTENPWKLLIGKQNINNSTANKWCPNDNAPQVVFVFADIYKVGAFEVRDKSWVEDTSGQFGKYTIETSLDGTNWTTAGAYTGESDLKAKYHAITPVDARYLRFTINESGTRWVYGFDIYGEKTGPADDALSRGATIISAAPIGYSLRERPYNLIDGYNDNVWADFADNDETNELILDLGQNYDVHKFSLSTYNESSSKGVRGFKVYTSLTNNGSDWVESASVEESAIIANDYYTLTCTAATPVSARYIKFEVPAEWRSEWVRLREFEVYGAFTFTGATDNSWSDVGNWNTGRLPGANTAVIINAAAPVLTEAVTIDSLALEVNAELGGQHYLTTSGKATVSYDLGADRWYLLSSSMETTARAFYHNDAPVAELKKFTPADNVAGWTSFNGLETQIDPGEGFAYRIVDEAKQFTVSGKLYNSAVHTQSVDFGTGWESAFALVGNPFVSTIDFTKLVNDNSEVIGGSYLIWTGTGYSGYNTELKTTWGLLGDPLNQYIAPLQSFIVEKVDGTVIQADITSNAGTILATGQSAGLRTDEMPANLLGITASNATASVRTFIAQRESGNSSRKLFATTIGEVPDIYTLDETTAYGVRIINTDNIIIPLGIATASTGTIQLVFTGMDSYNAKITLIDNSTEINLTDLSSYTHNVTLSGVDAPVENRFAIRLARKGDVGIDSVSADRIVTLRYYNLQGMEIAKPQIGEIYLVTTIFQSGKREVAKTIFR